MKAVSLQRLRKNKYLGSNTAHRVYSRPPLLALITKLSYLALLFTDGLKYTQEWLKPHIDKTGLSIPVTDVNIIRNATAQTLAKAYLELLEWDESKSYPEVRKQLNLIK